MAERERGASKIGTNKQFYCNLPTLYKHYMIRLDLQCALPIACTHATYAQSLQAKNLLYLRKRNCFFFVFNLKKCTDNFKMSSKQNLYDKTTILITIFNRVDVNFFFKKCWHFLYQRLLNKSIMDNCTRVSIIYYNISSSQFNYMKKKKPINWMQRKRWAKEKENDKETTLNWHLNLHVFICALKFCLRANFACAHLFKIRI